MNDPGSFKYYGDVDVSIKKHVFAICLCVLFLICSCTPMSVNQYKEKGWSPLSSRQIFELVSGNSIHLRASDFDGRIFLRKDGKLSARDHLNNKDSGTWDINGENQLCLKFKIWYYSDLKCYMVYTEKSSETYRLFTPNGAIYSTAKITGGDSAKLSKGIASKNSNTFFRQKFAGNQPEKNTASPHRSGSFSNRSQRDPSSAADAAEHTIKTMAKDCPGCNFDGADLRKASLINANLEGANLKGADMSRANLRRANLKNTDLSGALLINTNLPGADLRDSDLHGANLTGANLIKADLRGADTAGTIFTGAHLEGVRGLEKNNKE